MKSLWNEAEAGSCTSELALRAYSSRLLGRDESLVLYGGGNTSLKTDNLLYVKGSGSDLGRVNEAGFVPLRLECTRRLLDRDTLDYTAMMQELKVCLADRPMSRPSIETLLHAAMPFRFVEHTHAYGLLAAVNVPNNAKIAASIFGEFAPVVPYRRSGSALARQCRDVFRDRGGAKTIGLILAFHGVVAFGDSARASYENMIRLVTLAEEYLKSNHAWDIALTPAATAAPARAQLAALRQQISRVAGFPLIMRTARDALCMTFACRDDLQSISQQGPATPQHAIYTKRVPMLGRDVDGFARNYQSYLERNLGAPLAAGIDPAPRIVLDREFGMCALGVNAGYAARAATVYRCDMEVISRASAHDAYRSAPEQDIARAELEYGGFESALRDRVTRDQPLLGQVALITDAASRMDPGLAPKLIDQGAAVVASGNAGPDAALDAAVTDFGGIDLVFNTAADGEWCNAADELLALSPRGGRVVSVGAAA
jgi:rhamnose utilization protein RhaD (predicted bifunctional aldolase and dehydrogenase)